MAKKEIEKINFPDMFYIVGGDISLRRPGFSILEVSKVDNKYKIDSVKTMVVNNKANKKPIGQVLNEIENELSLFIYTFGDKDMPMFFVREKYISAHGSINESSIYKAVGISDLAIWKMNKTYAWNEIYPVSIKKYITGFGTASKEEVANKLKEYVGDIEYAFDDESDAVAVALSFLIQNGETILNV